jgi:hypothetical protein
MELHGFGTPPESFTSELPLELALNTVEVLGIWKRKVSRYSVEFHSIPSWNHEFLGFSRVLSVILFTSLFNFYLIGT